MPKAVKGIVVGALIGVAAAFVLPALGVATIAGAAITVKGAAIAGAIYGGLLGASAMLAPNMDMGAAQQRTQLSINPQADGKWVFGETPSGLDIVHQETIGDDRVFMVIAAAAHEIDSFGDLYIDDELITFDGISATGSWAGALTKKERIGRTTDPAISAPGQWSALATGKGIAHFSLDFNFASENENLEGGIPQKMVQIVKGSKVYDPRLDDTKGGSGAHRVDDQSTWEWSDNWALIVAHYLVGYRQADQLVYGVGVNPDDIDWPQVIAMANVCDEDVDGKPRYRVGGLFPTTQEHEQIIGQLEAAVGGKVAKVGGKYYIWCPHNDLIPINTITEDAVIREAGINFSPSGPLRELFNTARGRFIDPDTLWQPAPYPTISEPDAVEEDGRERLMERDFSIIQDQSIAERVAREMVRRTRFSATWTLAVGPAGLIYQPFSVLQLRLPETSDQNVLVRVIDMEFSPEGVVLLSLLEEDESIYDTTLPLGDPFVSTVPDSFDPTKVYEVQNLDADAISVTGSGGTVSDAFRVTWDDPGPFVRDTEVRYRILGDPDFSYVQATRITSAVITPVEPNTLYEIQARHISTTEVKGPYVAIQKTSGATSRQISISGSVEYSPTSSWSYEPVDQTISPTQATSDAIFTFTRGGSIIATRTVRATISPSTGNISVNLNHATSGEATSATVNGNNSQAVAIRVTHNDSGVRVTAQFTSIEVVDVDLTPFQQTLQDLEDDINTLETVTLPALQSDLDTLETVTLPNLQAELDDILPITEVKIANDAISAPKLQANSVIAGKIATNAVTTNTIEAGSIISSKIGAGEIKAINIEAGAVTAVKIDVGELAAITTQTGTLTANRIQTEQSPAGRVEITNPATDSTFAIWGGSGSSKTLAAARFAIQHNGDAKFGGRTLSSQLEGSVLDAVPIDVTGDVVSNFSNTNWVTAANRYVEIPETIRRPRRPFVSFVLPVFGPGVIGSGAWVRCQLAIQNDNGTYGSFFTIGQEFTIDTTSVGSAAPIAIGSQSTGTRGFRVRVQFRPFTNNQEAQTNRFSGLFIALPAGSGFVVRNDTTDGAVTTANPNPSLLVPPNFGDGWDIP